VVAIGIVVDARKRGRFVLRWASMDHEDRERKFEQALRRHLRRDTAAARKEADARADVRSEPGETDMCPDAGTLAAFHEGLLLNAEMNATTEHLAGCSRCQHVLLLLEASDEIPSQVEMENDFKKREPVLSTGALYVDYAARQTPSLTVAGQPTPASKAPHDISRGPGFKALRWAAPAGAIAAGLLIWIAMRDNKVQNTNFENVQVAQQQSTEERPATPRALPPSPPPEPATKIAQLDEKRKDDSTTKKPARESGALRAPKHSLSAAITNEVGVAADETSPRTNAGQLQAKSRNRSSRETVENKPPDISSRQADVSATATAAAPAAPSGAPRAKSAAPVGNMPTTSVADSANTRTLEPPSNQNGGTELLQAQQGEVTDKLELRSLKRVGFDNAKVILASNTTVRWRLLFAGRIEQSVDNGVTWVPQNSGVKAELLAGSAPSESVCWIVGRSGTILRTTDGGGHWNKVVSPIRGDIAGVQAADAMTAEIFDAHKNSRFVTHDGGVSWQAAKE
jgi:cytoskeletal protein RodZ